MKKKILFFLASTSLVLTPVIALSCSLNKEEKAKEQQKESLDNTTKDIEYPVNIKPNYDHSIGLDPKNFIRPIIDNPHEYQYITNEADKLKKEPTTNFVGKEFVNKGITFINNKELDPKTFIKPIVTNPNEFQYVVINEADKLKQEPTTNFVGKEFINKGITFINNKELDPETFIKPIITDPYEYEYIPNEADKLKQEPSTRPLVNESKNFGIYYNMDKELDPKTFIRPIITNPKPLPVLTWFEWLNEWLNRNHYRTTAIIINTVSSIFTITTSFSYWFFPF